MTDKKKNGWIKFVPSLKLPKERVSIAYDTHEERGVRYAYGYFQFYNGTCGCFWKDGNEQPKVVKAEDIKYWMPVPSLNVIEELVSEDLEEAAENYASTDEVLPNGKVMIDFQAEKAFKAGAKWQKEKMNKQALDATIHPSDGEIWVDCIFDLAPFKGDEKVKVIILKKDDHE